jgi:hypothetical protein
MFINTRHRKRIRGYISFTAIAVCGTLWSCGAPSVEAVDTKKVDLYVQKMMAAQQGKGDTSVSDVNSKDGIEELTSSGTRILLDSIQQRLLKLQSEADSTVQESKKAEM